MSPATPTQAEGAHDHRQGVRRAPLERVSHRGYRPLNHDAPVGRPWAKHPYRHPSSDKLVADADDRAGPRPEGLGTWCRPFGS